MEGGEKERKKAMASIRIETPFALRTVFKIIKRAACLSNRLGIISCCGGGFMTLCVCVKYVLRGLV